MGFIRVLNIILLLSLLVGCATVKKPSEEIANKLPHSLRPDGKIDTVSSIIVSWKKEFFDKNLRSLIDFAISRNFDLLIEQQKIELVKSEAGYFKGVRLPDLNLYASASQRKIPEYTMDGVGNYDVRFSSNINSKQLVPHPYYTDFQFGLQSSWELDIWGKLRDKKKAAIANFLASKAGKDFLQTQIISEISSAYYELLAFEIEQSIINDNIILQRKALDVAISQKEAAKINELGVQLLQSQVLDSESQLYDLLQRKIEAQNKINFLCGGFPASIPNDTSSLFSASLNPILLGVPSDLLKNRPDILQAELELMATNANVSAARKAFYPSININASIGLQAFKTILLLETPASLANSVLGGLTAPVLNRRALKAELLSQKAKQRQAYIRYEKVVVNAFMEVYNLISAINNLEKRIELKKQEVEVLKGSVLSSSELYKAGRTGFLEVITAQANSLRSQLELAELNKMLKIAQISLYRALGGGWN